jgi:citrate lyase subunit beta/citryl-CoA lyase
MCAIWWAALLGMTMDVASPEREVVGVTVSPQVAERIRRPHWSLARTWMLQPGVPNGRNVFEAAVACSADAVVLDIEDGLPDVQKPAGRQSVAEWLCGGGEGWVRINSAGTPAWTADLDALSGAPGLAGVMLAKTELVDEVAATTARLPANTPVVALVESAVGIEAAADLAKAPGVLELPSGLVTFAVIPGCARIQWYWRIRARDS